MSFLRFPRWMAALGPPLAILTACSGRSPADAFPPTAPAGNVDKFLLYVSNGDGIVNIYRYWQRVLIGELTDFTQPEGECTNAAGDVFITDYATDSIAEYAHAAKKPINVIDGSPYKPYGCAINPKNGDLAVANYSNAGYYSQGNVAVYPHATGKPTYYANKNLEHVNAVAYDRYGDLLATGFYLYSGYYLYTNFAYLPYKSRNFQLIALPPPGSSGWYMTAVQGLGWDGEYWTVDSYDEVYQYTININPQLIGAVELQDNEGPVAFYFANPKQQATQAVGSYGFDGDNAAYYWKYPAGGAPYATLTHGLDRPYGVAISAAK